MRAQETRRRDEKIARNEDSGDTADGAGGVNQSADRADAFKSARDEADHVRGQDGQHEAGQKENERAPENRIQLSP